MHALTRQITGVISDKSVNLQFCMIQITTVFFIKYVSFIIREGKHLYPFLSKLRARRSVRFGIVKVYVEKECRKIKFMYNIQGVPKKTDKSIALLFIGGF
jgi:hypothetical protein